MTADVDPDTGGGFDTPLPCEAYANAPDLRREIRRVHALGAERDGRRAGMDTGPPRVDTVAAERVHLLRRAALMDRMALEAPGSGAVGAARRAAEQLVLYDRRHPELVAGPRRPDSIESGPGRRPYVRQEYAAWTAAGCPGT
ncbi:hypothetical protein ACFOZ0_07465 [Streptomyces yaanensis]|uniref:Uncharacterized protein n=1 Tax=Streptomyces yaanensis TaxID=1142239 RepID=A0ABV7S8J3_9ACTN|nr:hypothetical protein [Streptomyces sp. CGMCC 4.7035]WNC02621.1 hypothetical protein Q2K21_33735 [Streptomyces sp. CGMCC 4.7035]